MLLSQIIEDIKPLAIIGRQDLNITDVFNNSKDIKPNSIFVCISGYRYNGHNYIGEAVKRGALAVIAEQKTEVPVTQVLVDNSRLAQALAVRKLYGNPTSRLKLVGITGTNGKTTISYLVEAILRTAGYPTGLIGTIYNKIRDFIIPSKLTTPDSLELARLFQNMVENKVEAAVMEVSSHALELHRVTGCDFDVTVFSNISRDHFDFHHDFCNYLRAKTALFANQCSWNNRSPRDSSAVINTDDPYSTYIIEKTQAADICSYGFRPNARVQATDCNLKPKSSIFRVKVERKQFTVHLPLPGLFNVYNALAAITVGLCLNIDMGTILLALSDFQGVPGRCEFINHGQDFCVMVDFAHNPSGLYSILKTIPFPNSSNRKIIVFGCEGGKDRGKRGIMGRIAARYADYCIITTDNNYSEDPLDVASDIEQGLREEGISTSSYRVILDRYQAIRHALKIANPGDTVIIAGKGHETRQVLNDRIISFNDRLVVEEIIKNRVAANYHQISSVTNNFPRIITRSSPRFKT